MTKHKLKELRELGSKKHRRDRGLFIVEGVRLVKEAVRSDFDITEAYFTSRLESDDDARGLLDSLRGRCPLVERVTWREMDQISDAVTSQGAFAVVRQKRNAPESLLQRNNAESIVVSLDGVSDPGNLGSIIRTCDWFGVHAVVLGKNSVELYNPKVVRATMGSIFHLQVAEEADLLGTVSKAREAGYTIYVTDQDGEAHFDRIRFAGKAMIIFGNEAWGVSDQLARVADVRVAIRRYGSADSLNVGVACGIVLSATHRLYDE